MPEDSARRHSHRPRRGAGRARGCAVTHSEAPVSVALSTGGTRRTEMGRGSVRAQAVPEAQVCRRRDVRLACRTPALVERRPD